MGLREVVERVRGSRQTYISILTQCIVFLVGVKLVRKEGEVLRCMKKRQVISGKADWKTCKE
jgi:hypothetical protein